jgi:hypothetical protein
LGPSPFSSSGTQRSSIDALLSAPTLGSPFRPSGSLAGTSGLDSSRFSRSSSSALGSSSYRDSPRRATPPPSGWRSTTPTYGLSRPPSSAHRSRTPPRRYSPPPRRRSPFPSRSYSTWSTFPAIARQPQGPPPPVRPHTPPDQIMRGTGRYTGSTYPGGGTSYGGSTAYYGSLPSGPRGGAGSRFGSGGSRPFSPGSSTGWTDPGF